MAHKDLAASELVPGAPRLFLYQPWDLRVHFRSASPEKPGTRAAKLVGQAHACPPHNPIRFPSLIGPTAMEAIPYKRTPTNLATEARSLEVHVSFSALGVPIAEATRQGSSDVTGLAIREAERERRGREVIACSPTCQQSIGGLLGFVTFIFVSSDIRA